MNIIFEEETEKKTKMNTNMSSSKPKPSLKLDTNAGRACFDAHAKRVSAEIRQICLTTLQYIQSHPAQSILLIHILIFSCSCFNNVLCDLEPHRDNNNIDQDDDDATQTLVSL